MHACVCVHVTVFLALFSVCRSMCLCTYDYIYDCCIIKCVSLFLYNKCCEMNITNVYYK